MGDRGKLIDIPDSYARRVLELHGQAGATWLAKLPGLLNTFAAQWALRFDSPFADLSYNYVVPATRDDGERAVLKLGFPEPDLAREAEALRLTKGQGTVRLLAARVDCGALLLERAWPGRALQYLCKPNDVAATSIAASVMQRLWRPLPPTHDFPSVRDWATDLKRAQAENGGINPLPPRMLDLADGLLHDLICSMDEPVLLHGDLHHGNILLSEREPWLAIDPKGIAGEPAAETGAIIRNPMPELLSWPKLPRVLERRVHQLAEELALDRKRVHAWATVQAILAAGVWMFEDHRQGWEPSFSIAEALASFRT